MPPTPDVKNKSTQGTTVFPSSFLPEQSFIAYLRQVVPDRTAAWMAVPHIHQEVLQVLQVRQVVAAVLGSSVAVRLGREVGMASGHQAVVGRACRVGKGACCSGHQGMAALAVCRDRQGGLHVNVSSAIQGETAVTYADHQVPWGQAGRQVCRTAEGGPRGGRGMAAVPRSLARAGCAAAWGSRAPGPQRRTTR